MKIRVLTISILGLLALSGCRSSKSLTTGSVGTSSAATGKNRTPVKRAFLNGIEVTPGSVMTSNQKTDNTSQNAEPAVKISTEKRSRADNAMMAGNIEMANLLQIK